MALRWVILTWRNDKWSAQNQSCKRHQNLSHLPPSPMIFSPLALNVPSHFKYLKISNILNALKESFC